MPLTFEELKTRPGAQVVETPQQFQRKGLLRKTGEFIVPTTTGLFTGEKRITPRALLGAGLEVGSFAIPTGAILRGAGLLARGARAIGIARKAARVAPKVAKVTRPAAEVAEPLTFEVLRGRAGQVGRRVRRQAGVAAGVGGVSGAMFGAGRALGEEEAGIKEIAGEAALTGAFGAAGGAVLAPVAGATIAGARAIIKRGTKLIENRVRPLERATLVEQKTKAMFAAHVEDQTAISNKLDQISVKARRVGGPDTKEGLVREIVDEGLLPKVEETLGNQRPNIDFLNSERGRLAKKIDPILAPIKKKTSLKEMKSQTEEFLLETIGIDDKTQKQIDFFFGDRKFGKQFGKNITAKQMNGIRKEMNKLSKSFDKPKDAFQIDVQFAIANTMRENLDRLVPNKVVRGINAEIGRLFRMEEVVRTFHNKKINVSPIMQAFGRYAGIAALAGPLGAVSGVLGPLAGGSILIAGLAAQMGSRFISNLARNSQFNQRVITMIRQGINRDRQLKLKLLREAKGADKALLEKIFGPNLV